MWVVRREKIQRVDSEKVKLLPRDVGRGRNAGSMISSQIERGLSRFGAWCFKGVLLGGRIRGRSMLNGWWTTMRVFWGEAQGVAAEGVVLESTLTVRWDLVVTVMTFYIFSTSCLALPSSAFVDELRIRHRNRGLVWDGEHPHLASDYSSEIDCVELL